MNNKTNQYSTATAPLSSEQRAWRWRILISTYCAYAGYYLCRKVFSICKTSIANELNIGLNMTAYIWATYLVAYALGQFVNSFVGRERGARFLLLGGLALSISINIVFGFSNSYWTFMVFMFFNGLVQASGWPGCVGGVAEWLRKEERGTIMGIWSTNYVIGNIIVKSIGGYLLAAYGWRYAFFGCTAITFVIWWLIYFWQRNKPEDVGLKPIIEREICEERAVKASDEDRITLRQYFELLLNPIIPLMGISYFCLKFLRYALDSWLPSFLNVIGLDVGRSAYYSTIFDIAGFAGAIIAGLMLDRWFHGKWAPLCFIIGIGMVFGYITVVIFESNPYAMAFCFGIVGFMLYGPDTIICGAAAVQVAGEKNGVAVAGLVNGIGSLGPILQELIIGNMLGEKGSQASIHNSNVLALAMSIAFTVMMLVITLQIRSTKCRKEN